MNLKSESNSVVFVASRLLFTSSAATRGSANSANYVAMIEASHQFGRYSNQKEHK